MTGGLDVLPVLAQLNRFDAPRRDAIPMGERGAAGSRGADRPCRIYGQLRSLAAAYVRCLRYHFKMVGVYAVSDAAQMVALRVVARLLGASVALLPRRDVGQCAVPVHEYECSVSVLPDSMFPEPAGSFVSGINDVIVGLGDATLWLTPSRLMAGQVSACRHTRLTAAPTPAEIGVRR